MHTYIKGVPAGWKKSHPAVDWVRKCEMAFLLFVVSIGGVWLFSAIVPFNMDEFIHYNTLICALHPFSREDAACKVFALNFLNTGLVLPMRAYHYVGSFPVLYYLPLFLLWPSPISARFLGLLFLVGGGILLAREFGLHKRSVIALLLIFFPYAFQHLVDTGPIGFHVLSVYLFYTCARQWAQTLRLRWVLCMTVIVLFGIWTKLSYVWLLPGIGMMMFLICIEEGVLRWRRWQWREVGHQVLIAFLLLSIGLGSLLLSTHPEYPSLHPYMEQLLQSESRPISDFLSGEWMTSGVFLALINPMAAIQRVYAVPPPNLLTLLYSALLYLAVPAGMVSIIVLRLRPERRLLIRAGVLYGSFVVVVLMIIHTRGAWAMHHAVLAYPFLILSVCTLYAACRVIPRKTLCERIFWKCASVSCAGFVILNVMWYIRVPFQNLEYAQHTSRRAVEAVLSHPAIAKKYVAVLVDWGVYYEQGLFGDPEQSVLFWWGMRDVAQAEKLREIAGKYGRKVLFVYTQPETATDVNFLRQQFALEQCQAVQSSDRWQILGEPDRELEKVCEGVGHIVHHRGGLLAQLFPNVAVEAVNLSRGENGR